MPDPSAVNGSAVGYLAAGVSYLHERQISSLPLSLFEAEIEMLDEMRAGCDRCDITGTADSLAANTSDGIGRRTFLVQSGILAALAALSACGISGGEPTAPNVPTNSTIDVN